MKKITLTFLSFLITISSFSQNQANPEIVSRNTTNIVVKFRCTWCRGQKIWDRDNRKPCPNCDYWTERQREYNICSVCRNSRIIITKRWIENCSHCNGKGFITGNISSNFEQLMKIDYNKVSRLGPGEFYIEKIIDRDNIVIEASDASLVISSDKTFRMKFSSSRGDFVPETIYQGTWQNYGNEDVVFRSRAQKNYGNRETIDIILCTQQGCSECFNLGVGFWHNNH